MVVGSEHSLLLSATFPSSGQFIGFVTATPSFLGAKAGTTVLDRLT